jgi:hypothetical protein
VVRVREGVDDGDGGVLAELVDGRVAVDAGEDDVVVAGEDPGRVEQGLVLAELDVLGACG